MEVDLVELRNELFDENFNFISQDKEKLLLFSKILTEATGIQVCTKYGKVYEHIEDIYKSVIFQK